MRIYVVRHGQTAWNVMGLAGGHQDVPLDAAGRAQANALGARFRTVEIDRILSSDLERCLETAEAIAGQRPIPIETDRRLRERSMGDYEGRLHEELVEALQRIAEREGTTFFEARPPNGESLLDVWLRLRPVVDELRESEGRTVVVTHGGTGTLLLAGLLGMAPHMARAFRFSNTGVSEIRQRADGSLVLVKHNDVSHLNGPVLSGDVEGVHS